MGRHRASRLHLPRLLLSLPAVAILSVIGYGAAVALSLDPPGGGTMVISTLPTRTPGPAPTETAAGVDPRCYATEAATKVKWCQQEVTKTPFLARYRDGQPAIARVHPDIDTQKTLAKVNGSALARHGLALCWLVKQPGITKNDVIEQFMRFHAHPGPVTPAAADQVTRIALTDLCPARRSLYDRLRQF